MFIITRSWPELAQIHAIRLFRIESIVLKLLLKFDITDSIILLLRRVITELLYIG